MRRFLPPLVLLLAVVAVGCSDDTSTSTGAPGSDTSTTAPSTSSTTTTTAATTTTGETARLPGDELLEPNAVIERVVDGDTIVVDIQGQRERVRLIGIDTPESVAETRPEQCYGVESSLYLESLLPPGTEVSLILDEEARDQFDRLLAYVVRSDGLFVNLDLVTNGYAGPFTIAPNDHYADLLEGAAADAAAAGIGLWGACGGPDEPVG